MSLKRSHFSAMASLHKILASALVLLATLITCLCSISLAQSKAYIVHMDKKAIPKAFSSHQSWFHSTLSSISESSESPISSKLIHTYTNSMHGFSATLTPSELETLKSSPGFVHFTPDRPMKLHTTQTPKFLGLNPDSGIWPASSFGEGVVIGLIDTGVWPESASFRDDGMGEVPPKWRGVCEAGEKFDPSLCNKKLIGARFFNKGMIANGGKAAIAVNSTRDDDGHGTHTASTAAGARVDGASYFGYAAGSAVGVAPRAHLAAYKCVWRDSLFTSDFLAAVDAAIADGVDVLSISLAISSDGYSLEDDAVAVATFAAAARGIFVSASAGNGGPLYGTLVNGAPWITTVAAGTVDRLFQGVITLGNGIEIAFESLYPGNSSSSQSPLLFLDACENLKKIHKLKTKIIVCRDNLSISDQVENAKAVKIAGAIFITNTSVSEYYTRSSFPAAFINLKDGKTVMDYINSNQNPTGLLGFKKTVLGSTIPAPRVDSYSARGPFLSCPSVLKPDILAPGTAILASWSPISAVARAGKRDLFSDFNIDTGTSMAAPHVAGSAALVAASRPDFSPAAIRSALITTSNPLDNAGESIGDVAGYSAPGLDGGAGHVDPNLAAEPGLVYDATTEDYINFLCGLNYTATQIKVITKSDHKCINGSSPDLNYPSFIAYFNGLGRGSGRVVREFRRVVTNVGKEGSSYTARLSEMRGLRVKVEPTKLVFKKKYEKLSYKLTLEGPKVLKVDSVLGSLSWVEESGRYVVRSPIVATSVDPNSLRE